MQVDPNNVPDKYMCEHCEPRPTDKKRARLIQLKKREDISGKEKYADRFISNVFIGLQSWMKKKTMLVCHQMNSTKYHAGRNGRLQHQRYVI